MNVFEILFTVAVAHAIAVASPGPDFALVVETVARNARAGIPIGVAKRAGALVASGIGAGVLVLALVTQIPYMVSGVVVMPEWIQVARAVGGIYLCVIAVRGWMAVGSPTPQASSAASLWGKGFATNALNGQAWVFFLAVMTVTAGSELTAPGRVVFALYLGFATACWFSLVSYALTSGARRAFISRHAVVIARASSAAMFILGMILINPAQWL